jgi:hypothetical protein
MAEEDRVMNKSPRWLKILVIVGIIWALFMLVAAALSERTPENITYLLSIAGSGLYTLILYWTRPFWLPRLANHPLRNAMILGSFNAAFIEALFLWIQNSLGAHGIAAADDLWLDLILTMPWYIGMVIIFVIVQNRQRFSTATVLLLGGLYEVGADGIVGGLILPAVSGTFANLPQWIVLMIALSFWQLILVYSSMVLPPAWVIATRPAPPALMKRPLIDGLRPLFWLVPYTVYAIIALFAVYFVSQAA